MTRTIDQPQTNDPNLSVKESSGRWDLDYVGMAGLTSGVTASYLHGSFSGTQGVFAPIYNQRSGGLTVTDDFSGRSTLRGQVGYTKRTSNAGSNDISGLTGDVDYRINLTGKTTAEVELSRLINVFLTSTAADIESAAALRVNWQATNKIAVNLQYTYTHRDLPGQGTVPPGSQRNDNINLANLMVTYRALSWLILRPYFQYQSLASGRDPGAEFNSKSYGIEFTLQWEEGVIPIRTPVVY
jgi:Putative beta-barrel porin 2